MHHFQFPAHLRLEKTEAAIVGSDQVDIFVNLLAVHFAAEQPENTRLGFDLCEQSGIASNRIANKARPERLTTASLIDKKNSSLVAGFTAFNGRHLGRVVALLVVMRFDPAPGFLNDIRIHRITHLNLRLFLECA